ncbi:GNAT family N-acetyltransferase [Chengkuizengella sediminis]|uniref:GNAT family N-acetyltransferase n=1 Tax=Chengkuizengella sediminis TaxID=1885917 RepID=UPI001389C573|nr:GNAT family protein [Chengkuizengella sediminis]NDI35316.1 GNAT family N-acetyltransferase [Chengkuizengella sediminis]
METQKKKAIRFLEGNKVYLRPLDIEDAEIYFQMLYNSETRRLTGTQKSYTREQISSYIEGKAEDSSSVLLLIVLKETDEVIGDIALQDIDTINRSSNIRIAIDVEQNQGKGYGSEAISLMLEYGFGILNLHRIELEVFSFNKRAAHVYEKLGFKREGIQRDRLYYNHLYHDAILMSILEEEYRSMNNS